MSTSPETPDMGSPTGMFRDRVRERDLDNFLVEELHASPDFLRWVMAKLVPALDPPAGTVAIQKSPPREQDRRQTDLRVRTPGVDPMRPFEEEREAVTGGLKAMDGLVRWVTENRGLLAELVGKSADTATRQR